MTMKNNHAIDHCGKMKKKSKRSLFGKRSLLGTLSLLLLILVLEHFATSFGFSTTFIPDDTIAPAYSGEPYAIINDNVPFFTEKDYSAIVFEKYSALDSLGRCGVAYANLCQELMPTEKRTEIGFIKPSGWHTVKYKNVNGNYLYNRCHLIAHQLAGENANEKNLITGTRSMNTDGMQPFENMVDRYIEETGNHVLYRITPIFIGKNLIASGVLMEAYSVEDQGSGICFNVYCYNVQPGIVINYETGESSVGDPLKDAISIDLGRRKKK